MGVISIHRRPGTRRRIRRRSHPAQRYPSAPGRTWFSPKERVQGSSFTTAKFRSAFKSAIRTPRSKITIPTSIFPSIFDFVKTNPTIPNGLRPESFQIRHFLSRKCARCTLCVPKPQPMEPLTGSFQTGKSHNCLLPPNSFWAMFLSFIFLSVSVIQANQASAAAWKAGTRKPRAAPWRNSATHGLTENAESESSRRFRFYRQFRNDLRSRSSAPRVRRRDKESAGPPKVAFGTPNFWSRTLFVSG